MLRWEVIGPADLAFPPPLSDKQEVPQYAAELQKRLTDCYNTARQHLKAAAEMQRKDYDTRIFELSYNIGDLVYRRNHHAKNLY